MNKLKNTLTAASLTAVMVFGTVSANAGFRAKNSTSGSTKGQCKIESNLFVNYLTGIIMAGLKGYTFINVPTPVCTETDESAVPKRVRWS
ncbi:MAG TPA: hypothetical protein VF596_13025 [Pyrinomonadaceae bacterium]|jgi:hypothetical protein